MMKINMMHGLKALVCAVLLGGALVPAYAEYADDLDKADANISAGRAQQAYDDLLVLEPILAGEQRYDYSFGVAALEAGATGTAVLVLQRLVDHYPEFTVGRLELARALYDIGDYAQAKDYFEQLKQEEIPRNVHLVIDRYLTNIAKQQSQYTQKFSASISVGGGYDSNANISANSTDANNYFENITNSTVTPSANNIETKSTYANAQIRLGYYLPLTARLNWVTTGDLYGRKNFDAEFVDRNVAKLASALQWHRGSFNLSAAVDGLYTQIDGEENEVSAGVGLGISQVFAHHWQWSAGLKGSAVRYPDFISTREVDRTVLTLALSRSHIGMRKSRVTWNLLAANDKPLEDASLFGRDYYATQINFISPLTYYMLSALHVGYQYSDYDSLTPSGEQGGAAFREDQLIHAGASLEFPHFPLEGWTLATQVAWRKNDSNVLIYQYDSWLAGLTLKVQLD